MRRLIAVCAAAASVAVVLAIVSATGSAQAPGPQTIHLISVQKSSFFVQARNAHKKPQLGGSVFGFNDADTFDDGTKGTDAGVCTVTAAHSSLCHIDAKTPNGTLSFVGNLNPSGKTGTLSVAGGTGTFAGARGSLVFKDITSKKTDVTVTLVG
jgi:hypothetical protein